MTQRAAQTAVVAPLPAATTAAPEATVAPAGITIPDVTGHNAELAQQQLEGLGLKNVELASGNPKYSVVILARNWTVTGVEPAPGTVVNATDTVILKVYKD